MTVYQDKRSRPLKWLVALIVFLLAMGITFSDVYGADPVTTGSSTVQGSQPDQGPPPSGDLSTNNNGPNTDNPDTPMPIPEPTTLLLLAGGLGAMYAVRRWWKADR